MKLANPDSPGKMAECVCVFMKSFNLCTVHFFI